MAEQAFQNEVISIADKNGWLWFHHPYEYGKVCRGWPDLVLVHPRRKLLLFRELKSEIGPIRQEQKEFLDALKAVEADAKIWRPNDWNEIVGVMEDDSYDTQEAQEVQEAFEKAYNEALYDIYNKKGIFKVASEQNIQSSQRRPQQPRPIEEAFNAEEAIKQEAFNKAYKAVKVKEVFNKAFQDYELKKEVREANNAYEAFNNAYEAFNKAEEYKAVKAAEEKAKATKKAAEKAADQAKEKADKTKKVAKKADKKDGEAFNKMKRLAAVYKKAEEALNGVSTEASETALNEALAAEKAFDQAKKVRNVKKAEAEKTKKVAKKAAKKAEEAKKAFDQAIEKAEKAALRTRKVRKTAKKAAADAGLHIEIYPTSSAKSVYRLHREHRKV